VAVADSAAALLTRDDVDAVLNLTIPAVHAEVSRAALGAGKHVYSEKPLAATREEADTILADLGGLRDGGGPRLGCAPDTVLGAGIQTARKAVDDGLIPLGYQSSYGIVSAYIRRKRTSPTAGAARPPAP
jgi:predicted dehydrogenase